MAETDLTHMRKLLLFILVSLISVIAHSCGDTITTPSLLEAERLAEAYPDSALSILDSLTPATLRNDDERMLRRLLILEANDRNEISQKDDKEITALLDYFIKGDRLQRIHPLVYYYAGRVYSDQNEYAKALGYYKKALRSMDKKRDIMLERRIHSQISYIFDTNGIYRHALRELKIYSALSDSIAFLDSTKLNIEDKIVAKLSLAECYASLRMYDSSLYIYRDLEPSINTLSDSALRFNYYLSLARLYVRSNQESKIDSVLSSKKVFFNKASKSYVAIILAEIEKSKATPNINKKEMVELLKSDILYDRYFAARTLAEIADKENDGKNLLRYARLAHSLSCKLQKATNDASLVEMEKIIDESEMENENIQLHNQDHRNRLILGWVITGGIALLLLIGIFYYRSRIKRIELASELEKLETSHCMKIMQLTTELEDLKSSSRTNMLSMETQIRNLKEELETGEKARRLELIEGELSLAKLTEKVTTKLMSTETQPTDEDFIHLKMAFSRVQPNFIRHLEELNLDFRDFKDALLIKIKIPQKVCADCFGITPQGVANQRRRLFKALVKDSGFKNWKEYILSL